MVTDVVVRPFSVDRCAWAWHVFTSTPVTDQRRDQWLRQAAARWAHLPAGEDRDRRIQRTAAEIAQEAQLVAVALPPLDQWEAELVLDEAVLDVLHDWLPLHDETLHVVQPLIDEAIDRRYRQVSLLAREQAASVPIRAMLIERRISRRLRGLVSVDWSALTKAITEVSTIIASEDDATTRALAEAAAVAKITRSHVETNR